MTIERAPEFSRVIDAAVAKVLSAFSVAMPAQVTAVNVGGANPTVDVTTCIGRTIVEEGREKDDPPVAIAGVPLMFPGSGVYRLTFPIAVGDYVLLVVADRSTEEFVQRGGQNVPAHLHSHEITDCFAIPGVIAPPQALTGVSSSVMVIGKIDGTAHQPAARKTDPCKAVVNATNLALIAAQLVCTSAGSPPTVSPGFVGTIDVTGSITGGSSTVEVTG